VANVKQDFQIVDEYIASFPDQVQSVLIELRQTIREAAPEAEETISYHMPTYLLHGKLVYFAAWQKHIALYAAGSAANAYADDMAPYFQDKGTLQFPLDQPLPFDLVYKIVRYRVQENLDKQQTTP